MSLSSAVGGAQSVWPGRRPSLCSLLMWMASDTFDWLHDGWRHHAPPPGEETLTDVHIRHLRQAMGHRVKVIQFDWTRESRNGADFELWVHNRTHGIGLRVQAKRENSTGQYDFAHWLARQNAAQCDLLIEHASRTQCVPVYLLYNHDHWAVDRNIAKWLCNHAASDRSHHGCSLVSAHLVQDQLSRPRISHKGLRNSSLPWNQVLCDRRGAAPAADPQGFGTLHSLRGAVGALDQLGRGAMTCSDPVGPDGADGARGGMPGLPDGDVFPRGERNAGADTGPVLLPLPDHVFALMDNHTGRAARYPAATRCVVLYDVTDPPEPESDGFGQGCVRVR
ncbi:DUF6615 family protein [Streptomyces sp. NPDC001135]